MKSPISNLVGQSQVMTNFDSSIVRTSQGVITLEELEKINPFFYKLVKIMQEESA